MRDFLKKKLSILLTTATVSPRHKVEEPQRPQD